jgi:putative peptidoglycan lipid II flippase
MTVMTAVMVVGTIVTEIWAPQFVRWMFGGFSNEQIELCVHLTRILLPAQIFFYVGGVVSAVSAVASTVSFSRRLDRCIYNVFIIVGGVLGGTALRHCFAGLRGTAGEYRRSVPCERDWRGAHWHGI